MILREHVPQSILRYGVATALAGGVALSLSGCSGAKAEADANYGRYDRYVIDHGISQTCVGTFERQVGLQYDSSEYTPNTNELPINDNLGSIAVVNCPDENPTEVAQAIDYYIQARQAGDEVGLEKDINITLGALSVAAVYGLIHLGVAVFMDKRK